jgi:hypothetical protein
VASALVSSTTHPLLILFLATLINPHSPHQLRTSKKEDCV